MTKNWTVEANGVTHTITYKTGFMGMKITVDGQMEKIKSQNWFVTMLDRPLAIEGADVRIVAVGSKVRLSVNGRFQEDGEEYIPLEKMPTMATVFMAISLFGGYFVSGIFSLLIGVLFCPVYAKLGLSQKKGALVGAFIGCCILQFLVLIAIVGVSVIPALLSL